MVVVVLKVLVARNWVWDLDSVQAIADGCGYKKVEEVAGRITFSVMPAEDINLSVYHENNAVDFIEVTFDRFLEPESLSESEYEDMIDAYYAKFNVAADAGVTVLGKPKFRDGFGNKGFPSDQDAVWLALWKRSDARFIIAQRHEDREAPFRICLSITPPNA